MVANRYPKICQSYGTPFIKEYRFLSKLTEIPRSRQSSLIQIVDRGLPSPARDSR